MRGYDYRLGDGMVGGGSGGMVGAGGRPGDASLAGSAAPQWWYPSGMGSPIQNVPTPPTVVCILPLVACVYGRGGDVYVSPLAVVYSGVSSYRMHFVCHLFGPFFIGNSK